MYLFIQTVLPCTSTKYPHNTFTITAEDICEWKQRILDPHFLLFLPAAFLKFSYCIDISQCSTEK